MGQSSLRPEPLDGEGGSDQLELSPQNEGSNKQVDTHRMCGTATDLTHNYHLG